MKRAVMIFVWITAMAVLCRASVIGNLAVSMKAGEWKELPTTGFTINLLTMGVDGSYIFQYTDDISWDPVTEQLLFVGNPHSPYDAPGKFICYAAETNAWREEPKNFSVFWHAYDHNAINPDRREFYHRHNYNVYRYRIDSESWDALPDLPLDYNVCCGALEWFPELDRLVFVGGTETQGEIWMFNFSTNRWTRHGFKPTVGTYQQFAEYNPVHKVLLFGGGNGNRKLYKMDASGQVTALNNAPLGIGIAQTTNTIDPVSGDYVILDNSGTYYAYDIVRDSWKSLGNWKSHLSPADGAGHLPATPVSNYGVILFAYSNWSNSKVFLYKHASGPTEVASGQDAGIGRSSAITVSPNPVRARAFVRINQADAGSVLRVFNPAGRQVDQVRAGVSGTAEWDASGLPAGVYVLQLKVKGKTYGKKVLVAQ